MMCKYLKIRTKQYEKYIYCKKKRVRIEFYNCSNCSKREFKKIKKIKKKSNKLKQLESKRFSILTKDLSTCYICQKKKEDLHEIFGGSNRQKSMKFGLVIPICRICHERWKTEEELREQVQERAKKEFIQIYTKEKFREEFGKYYF